MTTKVKMPLWKRLSLMTPEQFKAHKKEVNARNREGTLSQAEAAEILDAWQQLNAQMKAVRKSKRQVFRDGFIDSSRADHAPYLEWLTEHGLLRVISEPHRTVH